MCTNTVARQLLSLMEEKKTNLVLSVDLTSSADILQVCLLSQPPHPLQIQTLPKTN